jgi:hypothetical protein
MLKRLLLSTVFAVFASASNAAIISGSVNIEDTLPGTFTTTNFFEMLIPQFDDMGGSRTLLSVELDFSGISGGTITFTNGGTPQEPLVSVDGRFWFSTSDDNSTRFMTITTPEGFYSPGSLAANEEATVIVPSGTNPPVSGTDNLFIDGSTSSGPYLLADFVGTGDVSSWLASRVDVTISTGSNFTVEGDFTTDGAIDYVYTYENNSVSVPEPTGVAFLGFLICALTFFQRRRTR